jgi:hypothetical protein
VTAQMHEQLLVHLAGIFDPLTSLSSADDLRQLFDRIGWDLDSLAGVDVGAVVNSAQSLRTAVGALLDVVEHGSGELSEYAATAAATTEAAVRVVTVVRSWSPPAGVSVEQLAELPTDLLGFLLDAHLRASAPRMASVLALFGVLTTRPAPEILTPTGTVVRRAVDRPEIDTTALQRLVSDPIGLLSDRFLHDETGQQLLAEAAADLVGPLLADAVAATGGLGAYGVPGVGGGLGMTAEELDAARHMLLARWETELDVETAARLTFLVAVALTDDTGGRGLGVVIAPSGGLDVTAGPVGISLTGNPGAILVTRSGADFDTAGGDLTLRLTYTSDPGEPAARFGADIGTKFEIGRIVVTVSVDLAAGTTDFGASVDLTGIVLAVSGGDGDGFLSKVLPSEPITATADLGADWSFRDGLRIRGSGALEIRIAAHLVLGPITLDDVTLAAGISAEGLRADVGVGATLTLGPIVASMQGLGLRGAFRLGTESAIAVGFKPPHQIGFAVDAGPVTGGGLVSIDEAAGQYIGILQLDIADVVTVTAIGILTTRMPDGSDGFSLLVLITAEFPPIQLGFGFTLTGLGGLAGIHRSFVVEALRSGVRTGALGAILFPRDPVANANQLITTLTTVFPPAAGRHVFGPMVKLGWGPKNLLSFELGLILELPSPLRLVIVGRIVVILPDEEAAAVRLRLDVLGVLDFAQGEVSVDASLVDSRIAAFAVTGDMALRTGWKATKGFTVAVGGFHPKFAPPPGFPALQRLAISLATGDNPRIRLESYFAVTSNTIQFGGRLDIAVEAGPFSARAFAGLDAIVELTPFRFAVTLSLGLDIRFGGTPLLHAQLEGTLEGPRPWRAFGYVEFRVLFIGGRIDVDVTIGDRGVDEPVRVRLDNLLREAFLADNAWSAEPPRSGATGVSLRALSATDGLVVHPLGRFTVRQRALPLDVPISRYGAALPEPNSPTMFALRSIIVGTDVVTVNDKPSSPVEDWFAAAQFADLSEDEKLSRPGFEAMTSGGTAGISRYRWPVDNAEAPIVTVANLNYDEAVVNADEPLTQEKRGVTFDPALGAALVRDGATGHSAARAKALATPNQRIEIVPERYVSGPAEAMAGTSAPASYAVAAAGLAPGERMLTVAEAG